MDYIKGKFKKTIFQNENGFYVGLFKVKEVNNTDLNELVSKTITITGIFIEEDFENEYKLYGEYVDNERFGKQFKFTEYEKNIPTTIDGILEFLSSSMIKGCGEKTAKKIVDKFGEDSIKKIKENVNNLLLIPGLSEAKAKKIYESVLLSSQADDVIVKLKTLGFTIPEAAKLFKIYNEKVLSIIENNIYILKEHISFSKLDRIFLNSNNSITDEIRVKACIIEGMKDLSVSNGDTYYFKEEIIDRLHFGYKIIIDEVFLDNMLKELIKEDLIIVIDNKYYLNEIYEKEYMICNNLREIKSYIPKKIKALDAKIEFLENSLDVTYNEDQKNAIKKALENSISIISGGPGTGKTTIINAICKIYIDTFKLSPIDIVSQIALLAPTGRAAKKMTESTNLPASTIHRFLKWNKDTNEFGVNEYNPNHQRLIIVDEVSMIDTNLFDALLKGIGRNIQIVLVGDAFQLPSVGCGLVLNDIIESNKFFYTPLKEIYRQSNNSYIPLLAKEIKEFNINKEFYEKKDDYNFLECDSILLKKYLEEVVKKSINKGLKSRDLQILAPMYKGENGIDNLNVLMQSLFNPKDKSKSEIEVNHEIFRENDKVLQLSNNPDCNIYNGDIGYITSIKTVFNPKKTDIITIDFDGNYVEYKKEDMSDIKLAYAITIHKAQGSEFSHVIMPISKNYNKMLYNKLIYTGVSRAKKSLVIIGEKEAFEYSINNNYSTNRKTTLCEILKNNIM